MLILAGGLLAASVILLLPVAHRSGRTYAATPTSTSTAKVVGGVQQLPDAAAANTAGQDSSSLPYGAIAGLAAAGAVVFATGGWYARRRRLR